MNPNLILIRYGELSIKGKNKSVFIDRLVQNIRLKLNGVEDFGIIKTQGRIFLELKQERMKEVITQLKDVFGIAGFSPTIRVESNLDDIKRASLELMSQQKDINSFKVVSKRADKKFPTTSQQLNSLIGSSILSNFNQLKVDVHKPDFNLHIEVRGKYSYIYGNDICGPGGLPVGSSGRVSLLLSGGIDSPVAGFMALKRGAELKCIHFHSYPYTSERAKQKVIELAQLLTRFGGHIRVYMVPFTKIQTEINRLCDESYSITIMRRMMLRISERIAIHNRSLALVTGESLGQVASQTLESMYTINEVTNMPILRPLIGMDKEDIIHISKKIGTYETSILPYEDCCTIFLPRSPKTKPTRTFANKQEEELEIEALIDEVIKQTEVINLTPDRVPSYF